MKDLAPILKFLKISRARFISTANEIPDSKWRQSPATDVWSAAEIAAHLAMIEESIAPTASPIPYLAASTFTSGIVSSAITNYAIVNNSVNL